MATMAMSSPGHGRAMPLPKPRYRNATVVLTVVPVATPLREHGFASWITGIVRAFRAWRRASRVLAELREMSDRELFDIGLNLGDFGRIFDSGINKNLLSRGRVD
jgi:uncharacterized protein YjiS (DUF1127 family)